MGLLTRRGRVYHRWREVLPLHEGRECPDCGSIVCGRDARRWHREMHMRREEWEAWVVETVMQIARYAGMQVPEHAQAPAPELPAAGDAYGRVDLTAPDYDEEDEDDD